MGARIQNIPSNLIYDNSFNMTLSTAGSTSVKAITTSGSIVDIRDKNLTTFFLIQTSNNLTAANIQVTIDYGKVLINCQTFYNVDLYAFSAGSNTFSIDYSEDASTWTNIHSGAGAPNPQTYKETVFPFLMRYLKFSTTITTGTSGADYCAVKLYECRTVGSG